MTMFPSTSPGRGIRTARRLSQLATGLTGVAAVSYLVSIGHVLTGPGLATSSDPLTQGLHAAAGISVTAAHALSFGEGFVTAGVLSFLFFQLSRMMAGVPRGEAFALANARRLASMGWALAGLFLFHFILNARFAPSDVGAHPLWIELLAAAVLRGFAEIFREGAAMRDELEGTI